MPANAPAPKSIDELLDGEDWPSFRNLLGVQTLNAFNDNIVKFLLLGVALNLGITWTVPFHGATIPFQHVLSALGAGAYIVFSPISGWASDRFSKRGVILTCMWLQLVCFLIIAASLQAAWIWGAVIGFFLISIQSVIFAPAKLGIVKELLGSRRLGSASGWMQMLVIIAIIAGSAIGGLAYEMLETRPDFDPWTAAALPMALLLVISILALWFSARMHITVPHDPKPFTAHILTKHFRYLCELFSEKRQRRSALGKSYFWGFGMFVFLVVTQKADEIAGGTSEAGSVAGQMMACLGIGAALGGALAAMLSRRRIQLGLAPLGGAGLTITCILLGISDIPGTWHYITILIVLGISGSLFLTPLNAYLQDVCSPDRRGRMLAASSMLDAITNLIAVAIQLLLAKSLGLTTAQQLYFAAATTAATTLYTAKLLPVDTLRTILMPWLRLLYGVRSIYPERLPDKGGVLIVANHVSYIDAFIMSAGCDRPVRFLMMKKYYDMRWANWFLRSAGAIPIDTESGQASAAIKACVDSLKNNEVVCIFPEGELTKNGELNEFKRGMEIIAKKANTPVVPVAISGLFGSFFSHWGRGLLKGLPSHFPLKVRVQFAEPIAPQDVTAKDTQGIINHMLANLKAK